MCANLDSKDKEKLTDLHWLLEDIKIDLKVATDLWQLSKILNKEDIYINDDVNGVQYEIKSIQDGLGMNRLFMLSISLGISKLKEVMAAYGKEINKFILLNNNLNDEEIENFKLLLSIIKNMDFSIVRNKYFAHIHDDKTKRPLPLRELVEEFSKATGIRSNGVNFNKEDYRNFVLSVYSKDEKKSIVMLMHSLIKALQTVLGGSPQRV